MTWEEPVSKVLLIFFGVFIIKNKTSNSNDLQKKLYAYFTHTNILKVTVNYLVIQIFTSGVKDGVENANFKKENADFQHHL